MEQRLKQRLVGAIVLMSLAVVFVPILFDSPRELNEGYSATPIAGIPERPRVESDAPARITIEAPETPRLDAEMERERQAPDANAADRRASPEASAPAAGASGQSASARPSDASSAPSEPAAGSDAASAKKQAAGAPAAAGGSAAAASNGWMVQLGSFRMAENARALRRRLQAKGYPASVEPGPSAQGEVFRVFVGPMSRRKQAEDSAARLRREMALQGIVVSRSGG